MQTFQICLALILSLRPCKASECFCTAVRLFLISFSTLFCKLWKSCAASSVPSSAHVVRLLMLVACWHWHLSLAKVCCSRKTVSMACELVGERLRWVKYSGTQALTRILQSAATCLSHTCGLTNSAYDSLQEWGPWEPCCMRQMPLKACRPDCKI